MDIVAVLLQNAPTVVSNSVPYNTPSENCDNGCIRKCCPLENVFARNRTCIFNNKINFDINPDYGLVFGNNCPEGQQLTAPFSSEFSYNFSSNGSLTLWKDETPLITKHTNEYCIDFVDDLLNVSALMCSQVEEGVSVANYTAYEIKCENDVDITDGQRVGTNITKDGITYTQNDYFTSGNSIRGCICNVKSCVRKCCPDGETLNLTTKQCLSGSDSDFSDFSTYHIIQVPNNHICEDEATKIILDRTEDGFQVVDGILLVDDIEFEMKNYCLTVIDGKYFAIACAVDENEIIGSIIYSLGMIISMPFLLVTFLVYAVLPEKSLHRRALMSYVLTLLVGYIFLVSVQLTESAIPRELCLIVGYSIIFFFTVSFFWMNVMCVDMWLAFSGLRGFNGKKSAETRRFIIYCLYAWGVPLLFVFIVFMINTYGDKTSEYHPKLGEKKCFVEDGLPNFFYFYLPMTVMIVINIILFILTTVRIQKVKKETSMLKNTDSKRHSYEDDKQKFNLYLKLMLAMGINWSMELISWAVNWKVKDAPNWIWYLTDFTNALYGVVIFLIFVFKRKIWRSLKKRYYVWIGKPHLAHALSTSARSTRASNYSTTETGVNNDYRLSDMRNGKEEEKALNRN